jgi:hypothetical protein
MRMLIGAPVRGTLCSKRGSLLKEAADIHYQRELVGLVQMPGKEVDPSVNFCSPLLVLGIPINLLDLGLCTDAASAA